MGERNVIDGLNGLLADATVFYQKLRHYHWNVAGPEFFELHAKFEEVYTSWAVTIDEVAERVLMVGGVPLHTLAAMVRTASLQEDETTPAAPDMVEAVLADLKAIRTRAGAVIDAAEAAGDRGTVNLLDGIRDGIEKEIWMFGAWRKETVQSWR